MIKTIFENNTCYAKLENGVYKMLSSIPFKSTIVKPPTITSTSGWTNATHAFDNNESTYAYCGTSTDYIELKYAQPVIVTGIIGQGQYVDSVSRAMNLRLYSVIDDVEKLLCTTSGCANTTSYTTKGSFNAVTASIFRIRLSTTNQQSNPPTTNYPSRMKSIVIY